MGGYVMREQPILSDAEWALIVEMLQLELRELPVEIRHAGGSKAREDLHHRRDMVQSLLSRIEVPAAVGT
jgi:hypothetical protein